MNALSSFLQPAVRRGPRYSARPFYTTILVFTTLAALTWAIRSTGTGQLQQRTAAGVSLLKREDGPEVPPLLPLVK
jgi:sodium/potassium/calcium exchanger 6